jgi:hypothetical protein
MLRAFRKLPQNAGRVSAWFRSELMGKIAPLVPENGSVNFTTHSALGSQIR